MGGWLNKFGAPVATALLLVGVAANKLRVDASEADAFHARAAAAIAAAPKSFGPWVYIRDVPQSTDAEQMLKPNGYLDRLYVNGLMGNSVEVLLDQCKDSRDMEGHYPRVCYPSSGCAIESFTSRDWMVDGLNIAGCEYTVRQPNGSIIYIRDFFVLPDGRICRDMDSVDASAKDFRQTVYGVAQVQILFDASVGEAERDKQFVSIVRAYRPVLDALLNGLVDNRSGPR